jgi:hypothetical protein
MIAAPDLDITRSALRLYLIEAPLFWHHAARNRS